MDTIIFGLILLAAFLIIFSTKRWLILTSWSVAFFAVLYLFLHHTTTVLDLSF